jgi:hypothetical protein
MTKRIEKSERTGLDKKITQRPALLTALSLLSASLGVTTASAEDPGARPNGGEKTAAGTITHRKAGKGQQEFLVAPSQQNKQQLQINQQKSPLQGNQLKPALNTNPQKAK